MAADLKQKLQALQAQKMQKLMKRSDSQRRSITASQIAKENIKVTQNKMMESIYDEIDDDLNLNGANLGRNETFSDSETEDLNELVRGLKDENGRLHKLLGEKNEELRIFKQRWEREKKELTGHDIGSENVAQKIIELSKRNRELNVEVESGKTKNKQLKNEIHKLENEVRKLSKNSAKTGNMVDNHAKRDSPADVNKIAELEGKVNNLNSKVTEYRIQLDVQKKELKIAHKVLSNEIGEDVNIQSLLNGESNWRGRQQQIFALQNKVSELQKKLALTAARPSSRSSNLSILSHASYQSPLSASMHDERIRSTIKKLEQDRRENQQKLQLELETVQKDHTKIKEKHDAAKARNQILSQELKNMKSQISTLLEKGKHDNDLISALMREQEYLKQLNSKLSKEKDQLELLSSNRVVKANNDREINDELKGKIEAQERKVRELEEELETLKKTKSHEKDRERSLAKDEVSNMEQRPLSRTSRSLIPTPPTSAGKRIGYTNRFRRTISASGETTSSKLQLQETKSMLQAVEVERDRLIELVGLLQKRVDSATEECIACENKVIEVQRTNVKLEKQVERLKNEGSSKMQINRNRPTSRGNKKVNRTIDEMHEEMEELQTRLEIQKDENDALKEALDSTLKAKDDDMRIYQEMIEQTKSIYLQGLKQIKQTSES